MPRLPIVGADSDNWGALLNEYLQLEHKADGTHNFGVFNALTFGAKGDGLTDDTLAIQAALNAAAPVGGMVWLPPGPNAYHCDGSLTIPAHVSFKGGYGGMRRGLRLFQNTPRGSLLHVYTTSNFITMSQNSVVDGLEIYYPNQKTVGTPDSYGWTIVMPTNQHGATIRNICCPNPYQFIYANADGFLIDGIQGYPLSIGIQLDRVADVARLNNIQFNGNCWSDAQTTLRDWVQNNAVCMRVTGADELMIVNLFAYGYLRGLWFDAYTPDPSYPGSYGSITNFGLDSVQEGILVGTRGISGRPGFSISNGRIVPFRGLVGARAGIKFSDTVTGHGPAVSMSNVGFFGAHERSIWIQPNSSARITMLGGQSTEYTTEMVLCESPNAAVQLVSVRSFNGTGPRINNTGAATAVVDLAPMIS